MPTVSLFIHGPTNPFLSVSASFLVGDLEIIQFMKADVQRHVVYQYVILIIKLKYRQEVNLSKLQKCFELIYSKNKLLCIPMYFCWTIPDCLNNSYIFAPEKLVKTHHSLATCGHSCLLMMNCF